MLILALSMLLFQSCNPSAFGTRCTGNRIFLSNIAIPNSNDFIFNPPVQFQLDDKSQYAVKSFSDFLNPCPYALPPPAMNGTWYLTHFSKRFMQTTMADIDEIINRLVSGQLVIPRRSLQSLFRPEVIITCAQIIC
uniref:Secreted protein n=1 Tax=Heterorhabditis bacteriophora TaxID=37862 RepID=A0A1I7WQ83_HETBA